MQGWDLHPAQLPTRHAAVIAHFLEGRDEAAARLKSFVEGAARASLHGGIVDDVATGLGLLNFFHRGFSTGALSEADLAATGLTLEELRSRDFAASVAARASRGARRCRIGFSPCGTPMRAPASPPGSTPHPAA